MILPPGSTLQSSAVLPVHLDNNDDCGNGVSATVDDITDTNITSSEQLATIHLYLIRHGEAAHNIKEKAAKQAALQNCLKEGLSKDHPTTKQRMEDARKAVLADETLRDAKLSPAGRQQAETARKTLDELLLLHSSSSSSDSDSLYLPPPKYVVVSPLTRTLETCDIIFPKSNSIHVRDEICERRTGKPPDTRTTAASLIRRPQFLRYSMTHLQQVDAYLLDNPQHQHQQKEHQTDVVDDSSSSSNNDNDSKKEVNSSSERSNSSSSSSSSSSTVHQYFHMLPCYHQLNYYFTHANEVVHQQMKNMSLSSSESSCSSSSSERGNNSPQSQSPTDQVVGVVTQDPILEDKYENQKYEFVEEDKVALRCRTHKCMNLLAESNQDSIACITHKGYLRELERGFFGKEDATEFSNCEIRVYRLSVSMKHQRVVHAERVI